MRYLYRKKILILVYHGFTDKVAQEGIENGQGLHLDVKKFKLQIQYLKKYYSVISLNQLIDYYDNSARLPSNPVVITIDDGYRSNYTLAYPVLMEFGLPATIFLTTDFVDKKEMLWIDRIEYAINMTKSIQDNNAKSAQFNRIAEKLKSIPQESLEEIIENLEGDLGQKLSAAKDIPEIYRPLKWDEILRMIKGGLISIGSHTCSHLILTRCSPERKKKEIFLSKQAIDNKIGTSCRLFCYPNGLAGDFDCQTKKLLKEAGYSCGLTGVAGVNDEHSNLFELKRLSVDRREDLIVFIMTLSGIFKFFLEIRQSMANFGFFLRHNELP